MDYSEIDFNKLMDTTARKSTAFLGGNGFSINFDNDYTAKNLSEKLYNTHCHLKSNECYDVVSNKSYKTALTENFKATKKALRKIENETAFISLFSDAVALACSIAENSLLALWLDNNGYDIKLIFGLSTIDLVNLIVEQAKKNGVMCVNHEYWTILIFYTLALRNTPKELFLLDTDNLFVTATLAGSTNTPLNLPPYGMNVYFYTSINGMYTYLRFLFATNILLNGRSYDVQQLKNWKNYNTDNIASFLLNFKQLITTNYDMIFEGITDRQVFHLHGCYSREKLRVLSQSLGVYYNLLRYDLTTIVFGDYFIAD
jgi:hypothetical protein